MKRDGNENDFGEKLKTTLKSRTPLTPYVSGMKTFRTINLRPSRKKRKGKFVVFFKVKNRDDCMLMAWQTRKNEQKQKNTLRITKFNVM